VDFSVYDARRLLSRLSIASREMFSRARCSTACSATEAWPYPSTHFSWNSLDCASVSSAAISRNGFGLRDVLANATAMTSGGRSLGLRR
jgi:hypothetical protein